MMFWKFILDTEMDAETKEAVQDCWDVIESMHEDVQNQNFDGSKVN